MLFSSVCLGPVDGRPDWPSRDFVRAFGSLHRHTLSEQSHYLPLSDKEHKWLARRKSRPCDTPNVQRNYTTKGFMRRLSAVRWGRVKPPQLDQFVYSPVFYFLYIQLYFIYFQFSSSVFKSLVLVFA